MTPKQIEEVVKKTIESLKTSSELVEMFYKAEAFDRMEEAIREKKRQGIRISRGDCGNPCKTRIEAIFYRLLDEEAKEIRDERGRVDIGTKKKPERIFLDREKVVAYSENSLFGEVWIDYGEIMDLNPNSEIVLGGYVYFIQAIVKPVPGAKVMKLKVINTGKTLETI